MSKWFAFGEIPFFKLLGFGFGGIWEFTPALSAGLTISLTNHLYFYIQFMGLKINYYIRPYDGDTNGDGTEAST